MKKGYEQVYEEEDLPLEINNQISNFPFSSKLPTQIITSTTNIKEETPTDKIIRLKQELEELESYLDKEEFQNKEYISTTWKVLSKESLPNQFQNRIDDENHIQRQENEWYLNIEQRLTKIETLIGDYIPSSSSLSGNISIQPLDKLLQDLEKQIDSISPTKVESLKKRISSLYTELQSLYNLTSPKEKDNLTVLKSLEIAQEVDELMTKTTLINSWTNSIPILEDNLKKISQEINLPNENQVNLKNLSNNYEQLVQLKANLNNNKEILNNLKDEIKNNLLMFQQQVSKINSIIEKNK